jgi:hypothetical protein
VVETVENLISDYVDCVVEALNHRSDSRLSNLEPPRWRASPNSEQQTCRDVSTKYLVTKLKEWIFAIAAPLYGGVRRVGRQLATGRVRPTGGHGDTRHGGQALPWLQRQTMANRAGEDAYVKSVGTTRSTEL